MEFDDDIDEKQYLSENIDLETVRLLTYDLLKAIGEDPEREGLLDTPRRVARSYAEMFAGLREEPGRDQLPRTLVAFCASAGPPRLRPRGINVHRSPRRTPFILEPNPSRARAGTANRCTHLRRPRLVSGAFLYRRRAAGFVWH